MEIGRKIIYDKITGEVVCDTGEMSGNVRGISIEEAFYVFSDLQGKNQSDYGVLELAYGERSDEFLLMASMSVDPNTKELTITPR